MRKCRLLSEIADSDLYLEWFQAASLPHQWNLNDQFCVDEFLFQQSFEI